MYIDKSFISDEQSKEFYKLVSEESPNEWAFAYNTYGPNVPDLKEIQESFQFVLCPKPDNIIHVKAKEIFTRFAEKNNISFSQLFRIKINCLTMSDSIDKYHGPHVDDNIDHKVFIYYINDSDGDTYLFNERYGENPGRFTVSTRINPEMGKGICFDGSIYHASSSPNKNMSRLVLNINFK